MPSDYQLTYRGLTIGAGTPWQIQSLSGLEDLPDLRTGDTPRAYRHGAVPGLDLADGRTITLELMVFDSGTGNFAANVEQLKGISSPLADETELVYQLPGRLGRSIRCRPRRRSLPVDLEYSFRKGNAVIELFATDPRIYDEFATSNVIALPSAATGLTFDASAPFVFGSAGTGGTLNVLNQGNTPAPWFARIDGPVTDPTLTLAATGQQVRLVGTVNAGEFLSIDSLAPSVVLNGTASRYSWSAGPGSVWWELPVGTSAVQFGATAGTGTCTFTYRSAWL
jgi:hypothetical protein